MKGFARVLGFLMMTSAVFDFAFPRARVHFWSEGPGAGLFGPFTAMAQDFSRVSLGSLRYLAVVKLAMGALLYHLGSRQAEEEAK